HAEFDESDTHVLERFDTSAGNPVKEILLKLNLPDHRILKDRGEAKGKRKPAFGMPIPKVLLSSELKESQVYTAYDEKYPQAQVAPKHGMGKSLMRRGTIPTPKKKKDDAPKGFKTIIVDDNILLDRDEAFEYAKQLKVKLKAQLQVSPKAQLLLNLKKHNKESKKQIDKARRRAIGEGSGVAPESPYHSSSSNNSSRSSDDDKTKSEHESQNEDSDDASEQGDESDKSSSNEERSDYDESDKDSDNGADQTCALVIKPTDKEPEQQLKEFPTPSPSVTTTSAKVVSRYLNEPPEIQMTKVLNETVYTVATTMTVALLETIHEEEEQNHVDIIEESVQANVLNEVRNQLPKLLLKVVSDALKQTLVNLLMNLRHDSDQQSHLTPNELMMIRILKIVRERKVTREGIKVLVSLRPRKAKIKMNLHTFKEVMMLMNQDMMMNKCMKIMKFRIMKFLTKAARYEDEGIEEMVPSLWSPNIQKYNRDAELGIYHCIKVNKKFGYAYLEEIMVTRTDEKEYKFCEADFPNLNQNDTKGMYLLKIRNKVSNIKCIEEFDPVNALRMYIHRIVIMNRVEDMQIGVESYQTKLNLTKPQLMEGCLHQFTPYTIMNHPRGVVYEGINNRKRMMRDNELYKFSDGTLNKVLEKLHVILRNNRLGYNNEGMEKYKWTDKDGMRTKKFIENIKKMMKEQRRFRRLELFVGGRRDKTDYCLLIRPE
ncbi:hypothetical protein Tco_0352830, partial [Tanacetum coccineum]